MNGVLGLGKTGRWSAGRVGDEASAQFLYRLAFRREVNLGALLLDTTAEEVRLLRADAPYPGDPWTGHHDHGGHPVRIG